MTTLTRTRAAVAAAFATQGLVFISLTTRLPALQKHWDLSDVSLSLLLLMMVGLAGVGSIAAEVLAKGHSSARLLRLGLGLIVVAVPLTRLRPASCLRGRLAAYGVALGVVDATPTCRPWPSSIAMTGRSCRRSTALGRSAGWWAPRSHSRPHTCRLPWPAWSASSRSAWRRGVPPRDRVAGDAAGVDVPWRPLLLVGTAMVLFYMVDTAATTWGPNYLDHTFATPARLVALATFPYLLASGLTRLAGDHWYAAARAVGCCGPAVWWRPRAWRSSCRAGLAGGGAGFPSWVRRSGGRAAELLRRRQDRRRHSTDPGERQARVDAVIARFNQFNYGAR